VATQSRRPKIDIGVLLADVDVRSKTEAAVLAALDGRTLTLRGLLDAIIGSGPYWCDYTLPVICGMIADGRIVSTHGDLIGTQDCLFSRPESSPAHLDDQEQFVLTNDQAGESRPTPTAEEPLQ
jgi:hypothetical protein